MKNTDDIRKIVEKSYLGQLSVPDDPDMDKRILSAAVAAMGQTPSTPAPPKMWRSVMHSKLARLAGAAAIIIIAVPVLTWLTRNPDPTDPTKTITSFALLSQACAAEQPIFVGEGIVHIVNEILVYPVDKEAATAERLDKLDLTPAQRDYFKTVNSWLDYNSLPVCSLQADGDFGFNQLRLASDLDEPYTIIDQAWYDPATGFFARVMQVAEVPIFANSYDGDLVYSSAIDDDGSLQLIGAPIAETFSPPENPAEFLGLTAGLRNFVDDDEFQPIHEITEDALADGTPVHTYKLGWVDLLGDLNTYWLFRVRDDDNTVAQMEFVVAGQRQLVIRRVRSKPVEVPEISWNLAELDRMIADVGQQAPVAVTPDMFLLDVSLEHMIDKADFESYIFATAPTWTEPAIISDIADFANPQKRFLVISYRANDGRHLVLGQSSTFNDFFANLFQGGKPIHSVVNGVKIWGGGPAKWWTQIHLRNCGFTPAEDRSGYVFETPHHTYVSLAVNGQIAEEELRDLAGSLVPARQLLPE